MIHCWSVWDAPSAVVIVGTATLSIATPATTRASERQTIARMAPCRPGPRSVDSGAVPAGDVGLVSVAVMGPPFRIRKCLTSGKLDFTMKRPDTEVNPAGNSSFRNFGAPGVTDVSHPI